MGTHDSLSPHQFGDYKISYAGLRTAGDVDEHVLHAHTGDGTKIGSMEWADQESDHADEGEVRGIHVDPEHRRRGLASALWEYGHAVHQAGVAPRPLHSPEQSSDGQSWAERN